MKAADYLRQAAEVIEQRGTLRDKPDGERSMERAVKAYITLNGSKMDTELDGWLFMIVLKLARATAGKPHEDDYSDLIGYSALAAECLTREPEIPATFGLGSTIRVYAVRDGVEVKSSSDDEPGATPPASDDALASDDWLDPVTPSSVADSDGWIEHNGTSPPVFEGTVKVAIRENSGWESEGFDVPEEWVGWDDGTITHYKIDKES